MGRPSVNRALWPQEERTPWLRNAPSEPGASRPVPRGKPRRCGVVGSKSAFCALRGLGDVESAPPRPLNAQTARDRDKNQQPMRSGQSVSDKPTCGGGVSQPVNTLFQGLPKETQRPPSRPPSFSPAAPSRPHGHKRATLFQGASSRQGPTRSHPLI